MSTHDPSLRPLPFTVSQPERIFPTLTAEHISRLSAHGHRRTTADGEVLVEVGDKNVPVFVIVSGEVQALRPTEWGETLIVSQGAGKFSGEANLLTGRPPLTRIRVIAPGEVIQLDHQAMLGLVQTDAELSEIFMRAFILRRMELIAQDQGDVVVIGSTHSAGTLRVKEFL